MENIFSQLIEAMRYSFILKALIAGGMVGISSSIIGVFLVLRRFSLIGDGLAHVSFATVAIGLLLGAAPLLISIPLVMGASILIFKLTEKTNLYGDAVIGMISGTGIALGVLIASLANGFNVDLFSYLFGNILSINNLELILSIILTVLILLAVSFYYYDLFSLSYDEEFAKVSGIKAGRINLILTLLTSLTIVLGIHVVGTMLISSLIIFPAITALQLSKSFKKVILISALISLITVICGIFISYLFNLPTGATIVLLNAVIFFCSLFIKKIMK